MAVTGAASGIGAATAKHLRALGWRVACLDRNLMGARDGRRRLRPRSLVTAAGVINTTPFFDTTVAEFRQLFDIYQSAR